MDARLCDTSTTSRKQPKTSHSVRHLIKVPRTMAWVTVNIAVGSIPRGFGLRTPRRCGATAANSDADTFDLVEGDLVATPVVEGGGTGGFIAATPAGGPISRVRTSLEGNFHLGKAARCRRVHGRNDLRHMGLDKCPASLSKHNDRNLAAR